MIDVTQISSITPAAYGRGTGIYAVDGNFVTSPDHEPSVGEVRLAQVIDRIITLTQRVNLLITTLTSKGILP